MTTTTADPAAGRPEAGPLPEEARSDARVGEDAVYAALLERLSERSVTKCYEPFLDIPWDDPEYAIDPSDARFEIPESEPLGATAWYRSLPQPVRARFGLQQIATFMKVGAQFENVLERGLLEFALGLPNGDPSFRYVHHEVVEESRHSLMFQEFVNRTGLPVEGIPAWMRVGSRRVAGLGRRFPELFFLFVLGGEDPIDARQRRMLRERGGDMHPLVRKICQIHVTEEARHLSFARAYLRRHVPRLPGWKRAVLRVEAPLLLANMVRPMTRPSPQIVREYGLPKAVLREAFDESPESARRVREALAKVRALCTELGIRRPPRDLLWRRLGIGDEPEPAAAA